MLRRVRKSARAIPALAWVAELATMIQVSFLAFCVAGAALSMAYYDFVFLFIGITLTLDRMVREFKENRGEPAQSAATILANSGKWRAPALHVT
jgi:hypothetical protein